MSKDPLTPQLAKANGDVKRLCQYLAARRAWDLATDADQAAQDLGAAAIKLDDHLQAMIHASGAETAATAQPKICLLYTSDAADDQGLGWGAGGWGGG